MSPHVARHADGRLVVPMVLAGYVLVCPCGSETRLKDGLHVCNACGSTGDIHSLVRGKRDDWVGMDKAEAERFEAALLTGFWPKCHPRPAR